MRPKSAGRVRLKDEPPDLMNRDRDSNTRRSSDGHADYRPRGAVENENASDNNDDDVNGRNNEEMHRQEKETFQYIKSPERGKMRPKSAPYRKSYPPVRHYVTHHHHDILYRI